MAQSKEEKNAKQKAHYQANKDAILAKRKAVLIESMKDIEFVKRKAERNHKYYINSRDLKLEQSRSAYKERKANGYLKEYYSRPDVVERNAGKGAERSRKYRENNKVKVREMANARERERLRTNPKFAISQRLRRRFNCALRVCLGGGKNKKTSVLNLLGCSMDELLVHLESQFTEGMNWNNRDKWHVDHIKPCASFDLTDFEQQKLCFHYTNLQPLWAFDNHSKHDSYEATA